MLQYICYQAYKQKHNWNSNSKTYRYILSVETAIDIIVWMFHNRQLE